jgi:hypothetical protein
MVLNADTSQELVLSICLMLQQPESVAHSISPVVILVVLARTHHVFKKLVKVDSLFYELFGVALFEILWRFVLFQTLCSNLRVNFRPWHHSVVNEPVDDVQQRFNVILVSTLVTFQVCYRRKPHIANYAGSFVFSFR